jgi:GNAT superfamily N-acetyltransferase
MNPSEAGTPYRLRAAAMDDGPAISALIARSARDLSRDDYTPEQIEAALAGAFGLDSALVRDGTYFVVTDTDGCILACGGWSRRRTIFGGDARAGRDDSELDPRRESARIRAFFSDPEHARRGLAAMILERCEADAGAAGFTALELMATLPGLKFYRMRGFEEGKPENILLPGGLTITFVPMRKQL